MSAKNYQQTLDFLYQQLPMYQRIGAAAFKKDLTNTRKLLKLLGNPQEKLRCIHVAGTNGKGSVSHMLASVFQEHGFQTGLYTSPHLRDFRERVRVQGEMIPEEAVIDFVQQYQEAALEIQPSFFEWTVALAFYWFAQQKTDIAIIETGLGGRLDSTNVITPVLSVITNIGWDHMDMLGDTLPLIAAEKAGIIKPDVPVIIGESLPETREVFEKKANERRAQIRFADSLYSAEIVSSQQDYLQLNCKRNGKLIYSNLQLDLGGHYQVKNVCTVLAALDQLERGGYSFDPEWVRSALSKVKFNTGLMGRWQVLKHAPLVVADTGHNEPGLLESMKQLKAQKKKKVHFVISVVREKDMDKMAELLPKEALFYVSEAKIPRAMPAKELSDKLEKKGYKTLIFKEVKSAFEAALAACEKDEMVFVGGSTFTVAEVV